MSTDQPTPGPDEYGGAPGGGSPQNGTPWGGTPHPPGDPGGSAPYGTPGGDPRAPGDPYGSGHPYGPGDPYGSGGPLPGMPPLASLGRRLLARIVDGLIIGIPVSVVMSLAMGGYNPAEDVDKSTVITIVYALVYFLYEGIMLTTSGQTVGKRLTRIRVAMLDDGRVPSGAPGWMRAGVYALPEIVPCCGFVFWLVNVLWCTWDRPYRQCLHDRAARTVVVSATV